MTWMNKCPAGWANNGIERAMMFIHLVLFIDILDGLIEKEHSCYVCCLCDGHKEWHS